MAPFSCKERGKRVLLRFSAGLYFRPSNSHFGCFCCCLHADLTQIGVKSKFKMKEGRHQTAQQRARNLVFTHTHKSEAYMNTLSHTRLAPPLSEILQAGTLCTFRTLKTVFFANVGRLSTSLDPMYIRTTEFFAPLFGSIIANNFMISLRRAMYSQQHIFCVALIKLCSKRG